MEKRNSYEITRKYLEKYREQEQEIILQTERLENIKARLISMGISELSDMPKGPFNASDKVGDLVSQYVDLDKEIQEMIIKQKEKRKHIEKYIVLIDTADERAVLRMRYIDGDSWGNITKSIFGKEIGFDKKKDNYRKRIYRINVSAIEKMSKFVKKN